IRELIDLNFSNVKPNEYPTLQVGSIGQTDFEKLATALFRLAQGGYIVPDEDLERHLRNAMALPEAMQTTADENIDPASLRVPVPSNLNDPANVQIKKPIRYTNSERLNQRLKQRDALLFMEDLMEMKDDIETAIDSKK
ncbi:MAG: hypothetical protein KGI08_10910, partial [Thaumarchaeota archaeon]|nr:hypothetical protein [Nitrososphaerota archaeon]